jgi:hypothetical protein
MHYYLDGYNMMFRILRATEDFQSQRERIISDLSTKMQVLGLDVTVVFDAKYQKGEMSRFRTRSLEILYTAEGETADEYILNELKAESKPSEHTVVTSDKQLAYLAKLCHSHAETVEHFIAWLNRRYKNKLRRPVTEAKKHVPPTPIQAKAPAALPPEQCYDYYLGVFEQRLKEQSIKSKSEPKEILSDMQRWLRAFESR